MKGCRASEVTSGELSDEPLCHLPIGDNTAPSCSHIPGSTSTRRRMWLRRLGRCRIRRRRAAKKEAPAPAPGRCVYLVASSRGLGSSAPTYSSTNDFHRRLRRHNGGLAR